MKLLLTDIKWKNDCNTPLISMVDHPDRKSTGNSSLKLNIRSDLSDRYMKIPSKSSRIFVFLKCMWSILKDRSCVGTQKKSHYIHNWSKFDNIAKYPEYNLKSFFFQNNSVDF